jgi:dTDP-4-amino-4,6-dideoxygalactose transaminase
MGSAVGRVAGDLSVTTRQSARLLRLPVRPSLGEDDADRIVSAIEDFYG